MGMTDLRVNVEDLRVFLVVAANEHVTAAAGQLHLSQPAITRAIGRLEHQFGLNLFDRPGHRVRLNSFGRTLLPHAERIVAQLHAAAGELTALANPHAGPVRIGFLPSTGTWLLPDLIRSFRATEPGAEFVLRQGHSDPISELLRNGEVDLILTSPRPRLSERVGWKLLSNEPLVLAVPPDHRLAGRRRVKLSEVAAEPFVTLDATSEFRQISDRLCHQAGFTPTVAFEAGEVATVRALVAAGLAIAILPILHAAPGQPPAPAPAIAESGASRPLGVAWLAHRRLPGAAEAFRTWLSDAAATDSIDLRVE
jgi:LysR family transcriptional regulator, transcription activator of glutamate synthase operon